MTYVRYTMKTTEIPSKIQITVSPPDLSNSGDAFTLCQRFS